jgi:hypothetical protein
MPTHGFSGRLFSEISLLATILLSLQLISPLELRNLTKALSHLALCSHMINFACMADLGHHDIHQPTTESHMKSIASEDVIPSSCSQPIENK